MNQSHVSVSAAQGAFNEETEDDSDVEEAKLFSLQVSKALFTLLNTAYFIIIEYCPCVTSKVGSERARTNEED